MRFPKMNLFVKNIINEKCLNYLVLYYYTLIFFKCQEKRRKKYGNYYM